MKITTVLVLSFGLWSCSTKSENSATIEADSLKLDSTQMEELGSENLEAYLVPDQIDTAQVQIIESSSAILIYPTEDQIENMKKEYGEEDFNTIMDDYQFYQAQAIQNIDSVGIKTITASKRFIRLKGDKRVWVLDIRKKNLPAWNLIFFKNDKAPEVVPTINVTTPIIRNYFDMK